MSDTPITDALHAENARGTDFFSKHYEKLKECSRQLERELAALQAENERLQKGLDAVADLINESRGIAGLHLNVDVALWEELQTGGRFEEWLIDFDTAMKGDSREP